MEIKNWTTYEIITGEWEETTVEDVFGDNSLYELMKDLVDNSYENGVLNF